MPTKQVTIQGIMTWEETPPPSGGGQPPSIWPSPGYPAHPIAPGGPPPGIWPGPGYPAHPIAPGGPPPGIWPSPGYPAHPIAPGGPPPHPEHPIVLPPGSAIPPDVGIWPEPVPPVDIVPPGQTLIAVYVPGVGWKYVMVPVEDLPPGYPPPNVPMPKRSY